MVREAKALKCSFYLVVCSPLRRRHLQHRYLGDGRGCDIIVTKFTLISRNPWTLLWTSMCDRRDIPTFTYGLLAGRGILWRPRSGAVSTATLACLVTRISFLASPIQNACISAHSILASGMSISASRAYFLSS